MKAITELIDHLPIFPAKKNNPSRMSTAQFIQQIRGLIAHDDLLAALQQLRTLLDNSPKLDEAIHQSARFHDMRKQIRLGVVSHAEANLTQNQIRAGLLDLLREIEEQGEKPVICEELERAISILNSKNVVVGSTISAGGNVVIGDTTTHVSESQTSRRLRLFLYLFVPMLAIAAAFLWYRLEKMNEPLTLTVSLDNRTPNLELPFQKGNIALKYGDKTEPKTIETEAIFTGIPAKFGGEMVSLRFESPGFVKMDTAFVLSGNHLTLPIRRDNSLARIFGTVKDQRGNPVADAQIIVQEITVRSLADGSFSLTIPFEKQRTRQRIRAFKTGFVEWDITSPVIENEEIFIILKSK